MLFVKIGSYVLNIDKKVADNNTTINSSKSDISLKEFDFENKIKGVE